MSPRKDLGTEEGRIKAREDSKRHYQRNKESYIARNRAKKAEISDFLRKYKEFHGCKDCKKKFPYYVLDFDHRDPHTKKFQPARLAQNNSWDKMLEEINKCDVVCANCHRVRSHEKQHHSHRNVVSEEKSAVGVNDVV